MSQESKTDVQTETAQAGSVQRIVSPLPCSLQRMVRRHDLGLITRLVRVTDNVATGQLMREARKRTGLSLREMARRLGQSAPFVSDLELGRRAWDEKRIEQWAGVLVPPNDQAQRPGHRDAGQT